MTNIEIRQKQNEVLDRIRSRNANMDVFEFMKGTHRVVYLIVDCSGSMEESNKMIQARKGAVGFADEAQKKGYAVGLIRFASYAELITEPLNESTSFKANIEKMVTGGSTNMANAIQMAIEKFVDRNGDKVMCIVTDGMPDNKEITIGLANEAKKQGIDIMTIGTDDADRDFLEKLSSRKELAIKASRDKLQQGIISMAKMLPGKNDHHYMQK